MLKAVIIDDERKSRENLELLIQSFVDNVEIVGRADGVYTGIRTINDNNPDLVFLDIHLANGDGFQILDELKGKKYNVIFVTGHEEHAVKAFRSEAVDYLLKPVCIDHLQNAVSRVSNSMNTQAIGAPNPTIKLPTSKGLLIVKTTDIVYCKGDGAYTYFFLKDGMRITTSKNLKEYERQLGDKNFFRCHKSFLINMSEIKSYIRGDGSYAVMSNGDNVGVSKRKKEMFMAELARA
jgi:two-component system LytT family response regulator